MLRVSHDQSALKAYLKPGRIEQERAFSRATPFSACLLSSLKIIDASENETHCSRYAALFLDQHLRHACKVYLRFWRWLRYIARHSTRIRPRLRPPRPVSALLHFDTAPWFSGDTRIYVVLRRRIVTNEFIPEISLFSGFPITVLCCDASIKVGCTMEFVRRKRNLGYHCSLLLYITKVELWISY